MRLRCTQGSMAGDRCQSRLSIVLVGLQKRVTTGPNTLRECGPEIVRAGIQAYRSGGSTSGSRGSSGIGGTGVGCRAGEGSAGMGGRGWPG